MKCPKCGKKWSSPIYPIHVNICNGGEVVNSEREVLIEEAIKAGMEEAAAKKCSTKVLKEKYDSR